MKTYMAYGYIPKEIWEIKSTVKNLVDGFFAGKIRTGDIDMAKKHLWTSVIIEDRDDIDIWERENVLKIWYGNIGKWYYFLQFDFKNREIWLEYKNRNTQKWNIWIAKYKPKFEKLEIDIKNAEKLTFDGKTYNEWKKEKKQEEKQRKEVMKDENKER